MLITRSLTHVDPRATVTTTATNDDIVVRPVPPGDANVVHWLSRHRAFGDAAPPAAVPIPNTGATAPFAWVAEIDGRVVGFAIGHRQPADEVAHLCRVRVHEQFQHTDVAPRLARAALEALRDRGCLKVVLHHVAAPDAAVRLMQAAGFTFNRARNRSGDRSLEFYLDLYLRADRPTAVPAA